MQPILIIASIFGTLAVISGAFGAHYLKKKFTPELQKSFETGVKYLMYHALVLLITGNLLPKETYVIWASWCFIAGTILFSFSIFGLCIGSSNGRKLKFLGPVTPLGGLLLVAGWFLLMLNFIS